MLTEVELWARVSRAGLNLVFARPHVLSAARVRQNWYSIPPIMVGILAERGWNVNR